RVCPIVIACHCELACVGLELVPARRRVGLSEERFEEELDLAMRREGRVVVEIDVRNNGDLRLEMFERAVGFVAFHDEPAVARPGATAELWDDSADQPRGVAPGFSQ